jgi:RNA polymerase sigma-70 factor (ECF subfamily)
LSQQQPYEEKRLLTEIAQGNEKAFRAIYDLYFPQVSAFTFTLCKSAPATEEIVQDVFIKLWIGRQSLAQLDTLKGYIFSMARNRTIDHLRRLIRDTDLMQRLADRLSAASNDVEERFDATELQRLIQEALDRLSEQKQRIFQLSKGEGLSHDQIADIMKLSKSTVKNHLSETLRHLREHLGSQPSSEAILLTLLFLIGL